MPSGTLPASGSLGDPNVSTGDFQTEIDQLLAYVRSLQAEVSALSNTVIKEAAVRGVGDGASLLADKAVLDTRLGTSGNIDLDNFGMFLTSPPQELIEGEIISSEVGEKDQWNSYDISSIVPSNATYGLVKVGMSANYNSNTIADQIRVACYYRESGLSTGVIKSNRIGQSVDSSEAGSGAPAWATFESLFWVPLSASKTFELYFVISGLYSSYTQVNSFANISVHGYYVR